jgi:acyl-coenzyme A synthetase/AMP-(fatty) acid ligase
MADATRPYQDMGEEVTVTIANGAALSDGISLKGKTVVGLLMPATWTAAAASFAVLRTGSTYVPLYNQSGEVVVSASVISASEARWIALNPNDFLGVVGIKVRSGINGTTVNQGGARVVTLIIRAI